MQPPLLMPDRLRRDGVARRPRRREPRWSRALDRRLAALEDTLPAALQGDPHDVHAARVASRRVREGLAILRWGLGRSRQRKLVREFRRVTRLLGRIRELDVAAELVAQLAPGDEALAEDMSAVTAALAASRARELEANARRIQPEDMAKVREKVVAELADLSQTPWDWGRAACTHLENRAGRLLAALERTGMLYEPGRLHVARIALKRFRYTVELVAEAQGRTAKRAIGSLKAGQDVLGRMHDLHVLAEHLRADIHPVPHRDQLLALIEAEIRHDHARYLALRGRLEEVIDESARRFAA